jgi:three-Cys-motif partner protein
MAAIEEEHLAVPAKYDRIGSWSVVKHEIIQKYACAYSRILSTRRHPSLSHVYIDAFAGSGTQFFRETSSWVRGSPLIVLSIEPKFDDYYFVDIDSAKVQDLAHACEGYVNVHILHGDCNEILPRDVLPNVRYSDYRRGLCLLDPYGLHLSWNVIQEVAQLRTIDLFLNFPIADINRNVLRKDPSRASAEACRRMTTYWGDETWSDLCYCTEANLFGYRFKRSNTEIAELFRSRLLSVAGFEHVSEPLAMRNSNNAIVYYLFFASHKPVAVDIVHSIFSKYAPPGSQQCH